MFGSNRLVPLDVWIEAIYIKIDVSQRSVTRRLYQRIDNMNNELF